DFRAKRVETDVDERATGYLQQLSQAVEVLLLWRGAGMEQIQAAGLQRVRPFHERNAAALDRVGDDGFGAIDDRVDAAECVLNRANVVTIAAADVPTERLEFGFDVAQIADLAYPRIRLDLVVIDDDGDLAELEIRGGGK